MNLLEEIRKRFGEALRDMGLPETEDAALLDMVRPSQDPKFGDYQANFPMVLGKKLGAPPREVAQQVIEKLRIDDFCEPPEIAGPGFINLRIKTTLLARLTESLIQDDRLGVPCCETSKVVVVDFSAPNVAKPMHVGHIRSTAIGRALVNVLRFVGHHVISDNHIGDWGTQFGMILYGYRAFRDERAYAEDPVGELSRVYRMVSPLVDYYGLLKATPKLVEKVQGLERQLAQASAIADAKQKDKEVKRLQAERSKAMEELTEAQAKTESSEKHDVLGPLIAEGSHREIGEAVLEETAKLHAGDEANLALWREFLPKCLVEIQRVYDRLGVEFDETLGESFYHDQLQDVVNDLKSKGLATESDGAVCVFLPGFEAPMIIQKRDGAFLYATTDLATIRYREERWQPDRILYVVDHRQGLHFEQLFAAAQRWGVSDAELVHVSFGTVLGEDGRPFKTRSGDSVGLWSLLDEAAARALEVVRSGESPISEAPLSKQREVAERVGMGALIYADLAQNRTSDYVFSYEKMLAMNGNTATYLQYAYARVRSIFERGGVDEKAFRALNPGILLGEADERGLALELNRFAEALNAVLVDYRPHFLANYLYGLAEKYSKFFTNCPVLKAPSGELRESRLALCDLTARVLSEGLRLLGIQVVEKM